MSAATLQRKLNAAGYGPLDVDGEIGTKTLAALDRLIAAAGKPSVLQPSPRIIGFIKGFEKCRLTAYMPTPNDVPTIGWGSTGPDIRLGMTWNQAEADSRFASDLADFAAGVRTALGSTPTTQSQFDAMVSLAYNIGIGAFRGSTLLTMHKVGDFTGAAAQFGRWNKQAGKVLNGLTRRRGEEASIYRGEP